MDSNFWHQRWSAGNIGFHRPNFNEHLLRHWSACAVAAGAKVFVPLCGKSLDMHWLQQHGHEVLANEIVAAAAEAFFDEAAWKATRSQVGAFPSLSSHGIQILVGDFFALEPQDLRGASVWYDRAAQVALPPEMRVQYYDQLAKLMPPGAIGLSLALEYPQEQKHGPPFSVEEEEIRSLCRGRFEVDLLQREDLLSLEPRFAAQGLRRVDEIIYRLRRLK